MYLVPFLMVGIGIWSLYHSWRGIVPNAENYGEPRKPGEPMRLTQRIIFGVGGATITFVGGFLVWYGWIRPRN